MSLLAEIPKTGTYKRRAELLKAALHAALVAAFKDVELDDRKDNEGEPIPCWKVTKDISVQICKFRGADPEIWIRRSDPILKPPVDTDWKNESFSRSYDDKLFHLDKIVAYVQGQVEYNRAKVEAHGANARARTSEVGDVKLPDGFHLERDPKTGRYEFEVHFRAHNLTVKEALQAVKVALEFHASCPAGRRDVDG